MFIISTWLLWAWKTSLLARRGGGQRGREGVTGFNLSAMIRLWKIMAVLKGD